MTGPGARRRTTAPPRAARPPPGAANGEPLGGRAAGGRSAPRAPRRGRPESPARSARPGAARSRPRSPSPPARSATSNQRWLHEPTLPHPRRARLLLRSEIDPAPSADDRAAQRPYLRRMAITLPPHPDSCPRRGRARRRRDPSVLAAQDPRRLGVGHDPDGPARLDRRAVARRSARRPQPAHPLADRLPHRRAGLAVRARADHARPRAPLTELAGLPQGPVAQRPAPQAPVAARAGARRRARHRGVRAPDPPRRDPRAGLVLRLGCRSCLHVRLVGLARPCSRRCGCSTPCWAKSCCSAGCCCRG